MVYEAVLSRFPKSYILFCLVVSVVYNSFICLCYKLRDRKISNPIFSLNQTMF